MMKRPDWQTLGKEPDYRFSLANERTFLAWIRTALALLAGGVLLEQFSSHLGSSEFLAAVGLGVTLLAAILAGSSYLRWKGNESAMRHEQPLPASLGIPLLGAAVGIVASILAALLLFR